jgi:UDP-glucuronate 4-epimerase
MNILVTGAAGFIGSHLCERLVKDKENNVVGVDTFIGPTPTPIKQHNLIQLQNHPQFRFIQRDLLTTDLTDLLSGIDVIYHLAGMPGVRSSWGKDFDPYVTNNILLTQRLLEVAKEMPLKKFIYASTSSIYGEMDGKVSENTLPVPLSPYGITKLSGEHLCHVYQKSHHVPVVITRFFTVYGPRQRPDMAFHRFIKQILNEDSLTIFGDGTQSRDFTYISDCVEGITSILHHDHLVGTTLNIGGKERSSVNDIISLIEEITGKTAKKQYFPKISGEPKHTWADISVANKLLNYDPKVSLKEGLTYEIDYIRSLYQLP